MVHESEGGALEQVDVVSSALIASESGQTTLDAFVRYVLSLPETKQALYPRITAMNERRFWFSYTQPGGQLETEIGGTKVRVVELRVGLDVDHAKTPVEFSAGKYRNTTFVSGVSTAHSDELQFVLVTKPDGTREGAIMDAHGLRRLTEIREDSGEARS